MGNVTQGKSYVKGTNRTLPPNVSGNIDNYKSHIRISTASNIYSQSKLKIINLDNMSFNMPSQSKIGVSKKLADDIIKIND